MNAPIILCGLGRVGWRVLAHLRSLEAPIVVIDTHVDPTDPRLLHPNITVIVGDCRKSELLERAGLRDAQGVLILTSEDLINISTALLVRRMNPTVRVVVRMFNQNLVARLGKSVHNTTALSVSGLAGPRLALRALDPNIATPYTNIQTGPEEVGDYRLTDESPLRGRVIAEVVQEVPVKVIAHQPFGEEPRMLLDVDYRAVLKTGDRIMFAGSASELKNFHESDGFDFIGVEWAGKFRRLGRMAWQTISEIDLSVKICALLLLLVVIASTLFLNQVLDRPPADSLYRTISVIATGADMRGNEYTGKPNEEVGKVFFSVMRLLGVALIAAFTAILTNYLIRAKLGGVLEVRRIPDSGHVVVCGLGNVGFRVVEELIARGERVVIIEVRGDGPFVATCRRLGVAVIVGDAVIPEVLRQARAHTAKAIIATTSNELLNLEIALLVGDLNSKQRVVIRLSDPLLADTLRDTANMPHAVSIPALAAPAFFAAAFDDRVQSVFRISDQEMIIVDLKVQPNDPALAGRTLRSIAIDYNLVPLGVGIATVEGVPVLNHQGDSSNYRLKSGDVVTVVATGRTLARLVQREPAQPAWAVRVTGFPIPARTTVGLWLRQTRGCTAEESEWLMGSFPFIFAPNQTRGQAEDWLRLLQRERVNAEIIRDGLADDQQEEVQVGLMPEAE